MAIKELAYKLKPPCDRCAYRMEKIQTVVNPCPVCKKNGYRDFERFRQMVSGDNLENDGNGKETGYN